MLEVKRKAVLPRELRRIRASALTGDKKYGSVMDVLQIVYGQDFGAILKDYVDTHQEELYKKGIMPDSLFIRLGGIGKPYIETNYDQPNKAFFLDVVVDCLLDGEHYQRCVSFYIRYKMSLCAMDPRCFLWEIGLYRSDSDDELRNTNQTKADSNLLPKITAAKYDEIVYDLLGSYNQEALETPGPVDVYKIADGLKLSVREVLIQDRNILGQMHFWPGIVEYIDKNGIKRIARANPLDIFINILSCTSMVAKRSSLAHEIGHVFCSRFFEFLQIMVGNKHGAVVNKRKKQPKDADMVHVFWVLNPVEYNQFQGKQHRAHCRRAASREHWMHPSDSTNQRDGQGRATSGADSAGMSSTTASVRGHQADRLVQDS